MKTRIISSTLAVILAMSLVSCEALRKEPTVKTVVSRLGITGQPETVTTESKQVDVRDQSFADSQLNFFTQD